MKSDDDRAFVIGELLRGEANHFKDGGGGFRFQESITSYFSVRDHVEEPELIDLSQIVFLRV